MALKVLTVIPARLGSKRFPGKVIYPLNGKPLLFYLYRELKRSALIDRVVVATDSDDIEQAVSQFGVEVIRTSGKHQTGSDRVAEAAREIGGDIIINVQADAFGLKAAVIDKVIAEMKANRTIECATLAYRLVDDDELFNPNRVKVVLGADGRALWFSRFPLPYLQDAKIGKKTTQFPYWGHIGVYFFRRSSLERFATWKRSPMEKAESLEQLRIIENGGDMRVYPTKVKIFSIDCPEDLKKVKRVYKFR